MNVDKHNLVIVYGMEFIKRCFRKTRAYTAWLKILFGCPLFFTLDDFTTRISSVYAIVCSYIISWLMWVRTTTYDVPTQSGSLSYVGNLLWGDLQPVWCYHLLGTVVEEVRKSHEAGSSPCSFTSLNRRQRPTITEIISGYNILFPKNLKKICNRIILKPR